MTAAEVVALLLKYPGFKHTTDGVDRSSCFWTVTTSYDASVWRINRGKGYEEVVYSKGGVGVLDVILMPPFVLEHEPTNDDELLLLKVGDFLYLKATIE